MYLRTFGIWALKNTFSYSTKITMASISFKKKKVKLDLSTDIDINCMFLSFQSESTLYGYLNVQELLAQNRQEI